MTPARWRLLAVVVVTLLVGGVVASRGENRTKTDTAAGAPASSTTSSTASAASSGGASTSTVPLAPDAGPPRSTVGTKMALSKRLTGGLTPKSVVASRHGVVFAQNMIYSHTVKAYRSDGAVLGTIDDSVRLADFGITRYPAGTVKGGPVEVAFTTDGTKAYVSNYEMYGPGFSHPGDDVCNPSAGYDHSFVYRIDVATLKIDQVIEVGPVPKYVAVSPDGRWVLVTNWCGFDLSVIDAASGKEVKRLPMGPYPRGIVVSPDSRTAYVAVMGGGAVKTVDLSTFAVRALAGLANPRHLVLSNDGRTLFVTLNAEGSVAAVSAQTGAFKGKVRTGQAARSMAISGDGESLYVVNYDSATMTKVATDDLRILQHVNTDPHPIGITYDPVTGSVWVACYGGSLLVFADG